MVATALAVGAAAIHHEFFTQRAQPPIPMKTVFQPTWKDLSAYGHWIGDSTAKVRLVEFGEFECPYCRRFEIAFRQAQVQAGNAVALLFVQYPIPGHKFAKRAALAAECASQWGKWEPFHDVMYAQQDSLGIKSWSAFAADAGVKDTIAFNKCLSASTTSVFIDSGVAIGKRFKIHGTPTLLVDGWQYPGLEADSLAGIILREVKEGPPKAGSK